MNSMNVIFPKVSHLEELPNELFFLIFSYLKSNMVIQTFLDLNQRFQSLILQFTRHLVLSKDTESDWINKYMLSIRNDIETITLSVELLASVFSCKYSYPNLRSITMYLSIEWQVELNIENEAPETAILSALNVLGKCSFERVQRDFSKIFESDDMTPAISNKQTTDNTLNDIDHISPCLAIRRVWIFECDERNIWKLCHLAPELTYLKVWLRHSSTFNYNGDVKPARIISPTYLVELYIKVTDMKSFKDIKLLIGRCQESIRRITLDLGGDLMIGGKRLEALLAPYTSLENISFINQFSKKQVTISDILSSFQSEWWLDTRRSPVLIHETHFDQILVTSIPCYFSNVLKYFQFSSDIHSWHLNKGKLDSLSIGSIEINQICFSSKQPISLNFLKFAARIFYSRKQMLECNFWGLMFEQEFFKQFIDSSIVETILPNITRLRISYINGLSPLTLAVWFLLAPNVRILEIAYLTFNETMEWITELKDAIVMGVANNSYANCLQVAAHFATTVSNGPVDDIRNTTGVNVTCPQLTGLSCPGPIVNGVCVFQQKLSIKCINSSTVRIRVQSNGLPRRCMFVPNNTLIVEMNIDFEVNFNPDVSVNSPNQSPSSAAALSNIICNISSESTVPAASAFVQSLISMPLNVLAGVAVDGANIFNVDSLNQVDPFYPTGGFAPESVDQCLSHPSPNGQYHYHMASGCIVNPPSGSLTSCSSTIGCLNNIANYSLQTFSSFKTLTVIGIAKDGHVIYGPYESSGVQVTSGFDICNGMFYDSIGNYAYFATTTYPYITGCFGPGNYPSFKPNCTTNPAASYTKSSYATAFSTSSGAASNVPSSVIRFISFCMVLLYIKIT